MDPTSAEENSNEPITAAAIQMPSSMEKTEQSMRKHDRRHVTDKYWSGLFVAVLIIWVVSWKYVIHNQRNCDVVTGNSTVINNIPEFILRKIDNYVSENTSVVKNVSQPYSFTWGAWNKESWNGGYLDEFGSLYCFICSLFLLRVNKILRRHPSIVGAIFAYVVILEHLTVTFHTNDSFLNLSLPFHEKLAYWVIPETMFLILCLSKMVSRAIHPKNSKNLYIKRASQNAVDGFDTNCVGDTNTAKDNFNLKKVCFYHCIYTIVLSFPLIVTLKLLMNFAISAAYKMGWGNVHSYIIVGGSYYLGYTVYYFGLMVISYTYSIASRTRSQSVYKSFLPALFTIARYHFGTACFQATPIIPRLHAILVTREPSLNQLVRRESIERFFITNWDVYKLMSVLTSVDGTDQSHSIKNLLLLYYGQLLTNKSFQDFCSVSKCLFFFLLLTNSLALASFAAFSTLDGRLSMATWVMYLKIMYIFNMAMGFITAISDTFEILKMQSKLGDCSDKDLRVGVFSRYFLKNQPSNAAVNV